MNSAVCCIYIYSNERDRQHEPSAINNGCVRVFFSFVAHSCMQQQHICTFNHQKMTESQRTLSFLRLPLHSFHFQPKTLKYVTRQIKAIDLSTLALLCYAASLLQCKHIFASFIHTLAVIRCFSLLLLIGSLFFLSKKIMN